MTAFRPFLPLSAGIMLNLSMGLLYGWSVLIAPLEDSLEVSRATISGAYSIAFVLATVGTFVMHRMLRFSSLAGLGFAMSAMAAAGLAITGFGQSVVTLYIGFGIMYGFAMGVGYFVALTAASIESPLPHGVALSINMSAFALGGVVWPPIFTVLIDSMGAHNAISVAALILLICGGIVYLLLKLSKSEAPAGSGDSGLFHDLFTDQPRVFSTLFLGFAFMSFAALLMIGHSVGVAQSAGADPSDVQYAPMVANLGYIGGALLAGVICGFMAARFVLVGIAFFAAVILIVMLIVPGVSIAYLALIVVGACFGASSATYPVAVTGYYGLPALARVYGRIGLAYGLGGLIGPFIGGALYDADGNYDTAITIAAALTVLATVLHLSLPRVRDAIKQEAATGRAT